MDSAKKIIEKFGSQSALARAIGKRQSVVQHWARKGIIPAKWHGEILQVASKMGIDLQPSHFFPSSQYNTETMENTRKGHPIAKYFGMLIMGETEIPCYVLGDGMRLISRTGATDVLTDKKGGGNLESYIGVESLKKYLPDDLPDKMIEFIIPEVVNKNVIGIEAETFLEICRAYVRARDENALTTERQLLIAIKAGMFLSACAKVGLIALIDEATGYQYDRAQDALQFKLKAYLEEEMRKWEPTFPNELWVEFGRLTGWRGSVAQRPKYWGKLVMELVYEYLDPDVANWLRENAPKPRHGQNYHQWLSGQYGLKKLVEHLWMLIGMASACHSIRELKDKMAEKYGRQPVQYTLYLPPPKSGVRM
jgi:hypothetical protein